MIVLDTAAVVALQDRRDAWYEPVLAAVTAEPGPFVIPLPVLVEVDLVLGRRSTGAFRQVVASVLDGSLTIDWHDEDLSRIEELLAGRGEQRLGFADAAALACAERNGVAILSVGGSPLEGAASATSAELVPLAAR